MILLRLVAEDLSLQIAEQIANVRHLRTDRLRREIEDGLGGRLNRWRLQVEDARGAHAGSDPLRDGGGEGLVHGDGADWGAGESSDPHHHFSKVLDALAA